MKPVEEEWMTDSNCISVLIFSTARLQPDKLAECWRVTSIPQANFVWMIGMAVLGGYQPRSSAS